LVKFIPRKERVAIKKLWILLTLFLIGCSPVSITTPTTVPISPTKIYTPTPAPTATAAPYPSLQTDGPYLLFTNDGQNFTVMDADGIGRKYIELPQNIYIRGFANAVSPNGEWLAYFTGTLTEEPYDFSLNLLNLKNKSTYRIANLLRSDYPNNLESITELINTIDDPECNDECILRHLEIEIKQGILYFDWSPNSEEIVFAAQIDGISSDLYIYNTDEKSIRRLTNEPSNIGIMLDWAPNGKKNLVC
jgi:hypothetical protein